MTGTTSALNAAGTKSVTATCPTGKKVLGGGGSVVDRADGPDPGTGLDGIGRLTMVRSNPSGTDTWVAGYAANGFDDRWSIRAYAVCATG